MFATLGMFIIDDFSFADAEGRPLDRKIDSQIGGGGTYAAIGARIWLSPHEVAMVVDEGNDFPRDIKERLLQYGPDLWIFRNQPEHLTTRALNSYRGELRGFEYKTPRIRITPNALQGTKAERAQILHFICSPARAQAISDEIESNWKPLTIFEPIPDRCVPEELPALIKVLPRIDVLSPNAEEALSLLSRKDVPCRSLVEWAATQFLSFGVGEAGKGFVIIRSGALGAFWKSLETSGEWVAPYWSADNNPGKVFDVTGAGNAFLGGLAAGILHSQGDMKEAVLYATVSASYVIEQHGLPTISDRNPECWNGEQPSERLALLKRRRTVS